MADPILRAEIKLWGRTIAAVVWDEVRSVGIFQYAEPFTRSGIEVAPFMMPLRPGLFEFPQLSHATFKGLPGLLSDSLPDKFGNLLIDRWLAEQGRTTQSMNPVERLCYTGTRGMGALEFRPATASRDSRPVPVNIARMVDLASDILSKRHELSGTLNRHHDSKALHEILIIGTSAGGARAKAVLAWNPTTGEFRSGQVEAPPGFEPWLMKFDGVADNADKELADPKGFGRLEYACYLAAKSAGIEMMPCRLHEEGGRAHFMTKRFDRTAAGEKLHMQSLGAMRHFDFNIPRAYAYEQAIETMRRLETGQAAIEEQVRRAFFNILIRNQDDHVKNIAYLMDKAGNWRLSPAFDMTYAYNPGGSWTSEHQMSLSGKTTNFTMEDLFTFARYADVKPTRAKSIYADTRAALALWDEHANAAAMPENLAIGARKGFRLDLPLA